MIKTLSTIAVFLLLGAFAMNAWTYDGSVVTPSEQTIYYNFNSSSQTITITYPNTADAPWLNYTKPTGDLVIPDSIEHNGVRYPVTAIGNRAFYACMDITSVIIGDNVTSIGGGAFQNCRDITYTNFGSNVTTIGSYAFAFCRGLSTIDIPNSVNSIDNDAFYNCPGLTHVVIGSGLTYIGGGAFYICNNIKEMHIGNPIPPTLGGNYVFTFYVNPDTTYLHVPCGAASAYQSAAQWNAFTV